MVFTGKIKKVQPRHTFKPGAGNGKLRRMKRGALWVAMLMIFCLLLPACGSGNSASPGSSAAVEPVFGEADMLTVNIASKAGQSTGVDYMTKLAQDAGFHITFKAYTAKTAELFMKGLKESSNTVYICNKRIATQALDEGLLEDNYDAVCKASSDYVQKTELINSESTAFLLPTNFNGNTVVRPAVLVRTDLYNEYGKEIRSAQDYEDLLKWLKKKVPDSIPGLVATLSADQTYGAEAGYMALDLFLPEMGYKSLAGLCLQETEATNYLWMDGDGVTHAFYDLDDAVTAIKDFLAWKREGLVDFWDGVKDPGYPTILVNSINDGISIKVLDKTAYTYNIFSEPDVEFPKVSMVAIAGPDTDVTEFVRFIDWMQDIDHYKYMTFGVENVDYKWDGQYITDVNISDYSNCEQRGVFNRLDFSYQLYDFSSFLPAGFVEESTAPESAELPLDWQTRYELGKKLLNDSEYQNFIHYTHKTVLSMFSSLYIITDPTEQEEKIMETFEAIRKVKAANTATDLVNTALGN